MGESPNPFAFQTLLVDPPAFPAQPLTYDYSPTVRLKLTFPTVMDITSNPLAADFVITQNGVPKVINSRGWFSPTIFTVTSNVFPLGSGTWELTYTPGINPFRRVDTGVLTPAFVRSVVIP